MSRGSTIICLSWQTLFQETFDVLIPNYRWVGGEEVIESRTAFCTHLLMAHKYRLRLSSAKYGHRVKINGANRVGKGGEISLSLWFLRPIFIPNYQLLHLCCSKPRKISIWQGSEGLYHERALLGIRSPSQACEGSLKNIVSINFFLFKGAHILGALPWLMSPLLPQLWVHRWKQWRMNINSYLSRFLQPQ